MGESDDELERMAAVLRWTCECLTALTSQTPVSSPLLHFNVEAVLPL
jgi:hypothetical protein